MYLSKSLISLMLLCLSEIIERGNYLEIHLQHGYVMYVGAISTVSLEHMFIMFIKKWTV